MGRERIGEVVVNIWRIGRGKDWRLRDDCHIREGGLYI